MVEPTTAIWPRAAASMAVFRDGRILIAERGKGTLQGRWSLPGGHIEPGETARDAALREVREETGIEARPVGLVDIHEVIRRDVAGMVETHYLIAVFCGIWMSGEPVPADDCRQAAFVAPEDLCNYPLTDNAQNIITAAERLLARAGCGA
ncbi:MAG: hypothetical protein RLZ98_512 [Pseudomonadota bacterium]|jgi:ADP-ribose pyrophosphatase YjhB (NUDIX family)